MKDVQIIVTGGTIDKVYDPTSESLIFAKDDTSQIPGILSIGRCHFTHLHQIMQKDSQVFDNAERAAIVEAVQNASPSAIVVTHGTATLELSARWLAERVSGKTVVFTGAMRPYSLGLSDGGFNLGGAIIAAQILPEGVYGVMNGRVFEAAHLHKNTEEGRFDI